MTNTQPKVYKALYEVLKSMQVEKTGQLPSNMGNAKYATADAVSNATKNLFVANKLILVPNEELISSDTPDYGDKKVRFLLTIKGTYQAIHIEDGSSVEFSGIGNGLATGTAVAANIASTFALKNALQRLFLISEDSVDQAGHVEQAAPKQPEALRNAQKPAPSAPTGQPDDLKILMAFMKEKGIEPSVMSAKNEEVAKRLGKEKAEVYPELLAELKKQYKD